MWFIQTENFEGASELAGALSFNDHSRLSKLFMHKNPLGEDGVRELQKFLEDCPKVLSGLRVVRTGSWTGPPRGKGLQG